MQKSVALAFGLPDLSWVERPIQFLKNGSTSIEVRAKIYLSDTMQLHRDYVDWAAYKLNHDPVDSELFKGFEVEFVSLEGQGVVGERSIRSKRASPNDGAIAGSGGTTTQKGDSGGLIAASNGDVAT